MAQLWLVGLRVYSQVKEDRDVAQAQTLVEIDVWVGNVESGEISVAPLPINMNMLSQSLKDTLANIWKDNSPDAFEAKSVLLYDANELILTRNPVPKLSSVASMILRKLLELSRACVICSSLS